MASLRDYIKQFNEGEIEIVKLFGGSENFLRVVEMKGMMNLIDPKQLEPTEQNYLILYFSNNDIEKFNYWVQEFLGDITVVDGEYYLTTTETVGEVLGSLTCDNNRNSMDGKLVSSSGFLNSTEISSGTATISDDMATISFDFLRELWSISIISTLSLVTGSYNI